MHKPLLAIETTGTYCSVALVYDEHCFYRQSDRKRSHADELLSTIDNLLNQAELSLADCAGIAVNIGPGSFTGIRIGIAVAQGLSFGADITTCAVSSLQAMVLDASQRPFQSQGSGNTGSDGCNSTTWVALLHAREDEFYFAEYQLDNNGYPVLSGKETVINEVTIAEWLEDRSGCADQQTVFVGEAWQRIPHPMITVTPTDVNAKTIAQVARFKFAQKMTLEPTELVPSYLKDEMHYRTVNNDNQPA